MLVPTRAKEMMSKGKIIAFATCDEKGWPNVVPILQHWWIDEDLMVIGDLLLKASRDNVLHNQRVCISVWDDDSGEGYKLKGQARYEIHGPEYEYAKNEIRKTKPNDPKGVVIINFTGVYDISRGPKAGRLITGEAS